jgi:hypothetical protein
MEYTDSSFTGLMFNVNKLPEGVDILEYFEPLAGYDEFKVDMPLPGLDRNKVISYIILFYDRKTPLLRIDNVLARKHEAARLAKFTMRKGEYSNGYQEVITNVHTVLNKMIMRYIRMQKSAKFAKFIIYDEALYLQMGKLRIDDKGDKEKTNDILTAIDKMSRVHEQLQSDLLSGDNTQGLLDEMYSQVEFAQLELRPEDIAQKIEDGDDPLCGFNEFEQN